MCSGASDSWITLLEEEKQSVEKDNPEHAFVCERIDVLTWKLWVEQDELFPESK